PGAPATGPISLPPLATDRRWLGVADRPARPSRLPALHEPRSPAADLSRERPGRGLHRAVPLAVRRRAAQPRSGRRAVPRDARFRRRSGRGAALGARFLRLRLRVVLAGPRALPPPPCASV